jgi:hypothetical protein
MGRKGSKRRGKRARLSTVDVPAQKVAALQPAGQASRLSPRASCAKSAPAAKRHKPGSSPRDFSTGLFQVEPSSTGSVLSALAPAELQPDLATFREPLVVPQPQQDGAAAAPVDQEAPSLVVEQLFRFLDGLAEEDSTEVGAQVFRWLVHPLDQTKFETECGSNQHCNVARTMTCAWRLRCWERRAVFIRRNAAHYSALCTLKQLHGILDNCPFRVLSATFAVCLRLLRM